MLWNNTPSKSKRSLQNNMSPGQTHPGSRGANLLTLYNIEYNENHLINDNFVTLRRLSEPTAQRTRRTGHPSSKGISVRLN